MRLLLQDGRRRAALRRAHQRRARFRATGGERRSGRGAMTSIGAALFVGAVRELLIDEAAYAEMAAGGSPYGDGYAAARISAVFGFGQRAAAGVPARSGSPCTHCQQELTAAKSRLPRCPPPWSSVQRSNPASKPVSNSVHPQSRIKSWTSPSCLIPEWSVLRSCLGPGGASAIPIGHRNAVTVGSIWVNAGIFPPCGFIARAMGLAMMTAA